MIPLALKLKDIKDCHVACRDRVDRFIANLVGDFSCHEVCEAIVSDPKFEGVFDWYKGMFHGTWEHSWLVFKDDPYVILDPYPWACGSGPLLVTTNGWTPWRFLYQGEKVK